MTVYNTYITFQMSFLATKITSGTMRIRYSHLNEEKEYAFVKLNGVQRSDVHISSKTMECLLEAD